MDIFDNLFSAFSTKPAEEASRLQQQGLTQGYGLARDLSQAGTGELRTQFGKASDLYGGLQAQTGAGSQAYADATGANGPEGLARARALFTATPGYQEGINMSLDQNDRRAASRGMLGSGNTAADTAKLATDYAPQKYGQYTSALSPYLGANQAAVQGGAGVDVGLGTAVNANQQALGQLGYQTEADKAKAQANAELAKYQASQNMLNFGLKAAGLVAGGMGGFPGMGSTIGGWLGGGGGPYGGSPGTNPNLNPVSQPYYAAGWAPGQANNPYPTAERGGQISGPTIVGEAGPELFYPPTGSGTVVPNNVAFGGPTEGDTLAKWLAQAGSPTIPAHRAFRSV